MEQSEWIKLDDHPEMTCLVCGHKKWCMMSPDGEEVWCGRMPSNRPSKDGWLHNVKAKDGFDATSLPPPRPKAPKKTLGDAPALAKQFYGAIGHDTLKSLTARLGVTEEALRRLRTGWANASELGELDTKCSGLGAYTFPMRDACQRIIGIRLRSVDGKRKYGVRGSKAGLFIPSDLNLDEPLFLVEGPTDTAAMLSRGMQTIGRPSNVGGRDILIEFLKLHRKNENLIVVADNDEVDNHTGRRPGEFGAQTLVNDLKDAGIHHVKIMHPPKGKDARQWIAKYGGSKGMMGRILKLTKFARKKDLTPTPPAINIPA